MKNTPNVTPSTNGASKNGAKFIITPGEMVPVSKLIEAAKDGQPADEGKAYPMPAPEPETAPEPVTSTAPEVKPEPAPEPVAAPVAVAPVEPVKPALSRAEQVQYWNEKARRISQINAQLTSLKAKRDQLNEFSFTVQQNDDHRFARISIFDEHGTQFDCKNHALVALTVDFLKEKFLTKIDEKETEFLAVAHE